MEKEDNKEKKKDNVSSWYLGSRRVTDCMNARLLKEKSTA
jgi:hypothetical protein